MDPIEVRKAEHVEIASSRDVSSRPGPGWSDVRLVHCALPEIDRDEVDPSVQFLGRRLRYPVFISAMTGGHERGAEVNAVLAQAAEKFGIAMGLGSQRAALKLPHLARTYVVARERAPTAFLIANIGAPQLVPQDGAPALSVDEARKLVEMVHADALAVHLNFLQEVVQPEGDRRARGCLKAISDLCGAVGVPVIAKETGAGMSYRVACLLKDAGVAALDVGGAGGTSFAAVEAERAARYGKRQAQRLGQVFRDWGIPTAVSVMEAARVGLPVVATGGVRTGLDAAKAIALGATAVGVARPLLEAALEGYEQVESWLEQFVAELEAAMFLTGAPTVADLQHRPVVLLGETLEWLRQLRKGR